MHQPIDRIRSATASLHEQLDALPYARAVLDGTVPVATYGRFLRALHVVHVALEDAVAQASARERGDGVRIAEVVGAVQARRARLEQDLTALAVDPHDVDPSILHALVLAQRIRLAPLRDPRQLLGVAYVLEGSQLGGLLQHKMLALRPELRSGGLSYLAGSGSDTRAQFVAFVARLNAALATPDALLSAIEGARMTFAGFEAIVRGLDARCALDPRSAPAGDPEMRWPSAALNEDAGTHAIPSDLREIVAALAAGERSWGAWAYYEARYGARGRSFTRSDSAWLATLAREEPSLAERQLGWLATVLAARGMPRLLLEEHLLVLHEALCGARPEQAEAYRPLRAAALVLRAARLAVMSELRAKALVAAFSEPLAPESGIAPDEAATLLIAAVADEHHGVVGAVESLRGWLADAARFTPEWTAQVDRTLAEARALARRP